MSNKGTHGRTEVYKDGKWIEVCHLEIKKGDRFRGFKNNGHLLKNEDDGTDNIATEDAREYTESECLNHGCVSGVIIKSKPAKYDIK